MISASGAVFIILMRNQKDYRQPTKADVPNTAQTQSRQNQKIEAMRTDITAAFIGISLWMTAAVPPYVPATANLISAWLMDNNPSDSWGSNHGVLMPANGGPQPTFDRCGNANSAYHFNGTTNHILTSQWGPSGNNARTISLWMRSNNTSFGSTATVKSLVAYGNGAGNGDAFEVEQNYCAQGIGVDVNNQASSSQNACVNDNGWHHVVVTYDPSFGASFANCKIYIDGVLQASYCYLSGSTQAINTAVTQYPITIGKDQKTSNSRYYSGDMDEVYIWNIALTQSQVLQLFQYSCGIKSNPCFCNNGNIFTAPFYPGATYSWTFPFPWTYAQSNNYAYVSSGSGSGLVTCQITTPCGGVFTHTVNYTYCNVNNVNTPTLGLQPKTLCSNAVQCVNLTAGTAPQFNVTYNWIPGNLTGFQVQVCPLVTTVYTVVATNSEGCYAIGTVQVSVIENCCPSNTATATEIVNNSSGTFNGGSYVISSNITLGGNTNFSNAEFMMFPNVKITVPAGVNLDISNSHLYACGLKMWDGIVVMDQGSISTPPSARSCNLIEDAKTAIDLSNISASHAVPPLGLHYTTFNKNRISINISTSPLNKLALDIRGCVFTSRFLSFTSTSWPCTFTLRSAATGATTDIIPPYQMNPHPPVGLKMPFSGGWPDAGIMISNIGNVSGMPTSAGVDIGQTYLGPQSDFNLFDNLGTGIRVMDASLSTMNNVFQNMFYQPGSYAGTGIEHFITPGNLMNARLDLGPVGTSNQFTDFGNRFWNCYTGVDARDVLDLNIEYALFRSDKPMMPNPMTGQTGINYETNRFNINTRFCEFNNVVDGIVMNTQNGMWDDGSGPNPGIYAAGMRIEQNYFGPQVTSSAPLLSGEFSNQAIMISGPNAPIYFIPAGAPPAGTIWSNKINRLFRGIEINSMFDHPMDISGNLIDIADDFLYNMPQKGIYVYDNQGNMTVTNNTLTSTGTGWPNTTLIHMKDNGGTNSPVVDCNDVSAANTGFEFEGNNGSASWLGNTMSNLQYGMMLSSNGFIGQQGSSSLGCGNNWVAPITWDTWCNTSNANFSTLYVNGGAISGPLSNSGGFVPYINGTNLFWNSKGTPYFSCPATSFPPVPTQRLSSTTGVGEADIAGNELEIFPNPVTSNVTISHSAFADKLQNVMIFDLTGRKVREQVIRFESGNAMLSLDLQPGIYLIRTELSGREISRKIMVQ
jgi:hypothetical protein